MWCSHCQTDVPHRASSAERPSCCFRCGRLAGAAEDTDQRGDRKRRAGSDEGLNLETDSVSRIASAARAATDDWTLAVEVGRVRRLLRNSMTGDNSDAPWRADGNHSLNGDNDAPAKLRGTTAALRPSAVRLGGRVRLASLTVLAVGVAAFCYGAAISISLVDASPVVARLGVPLMLAGLFGLLLGLLMQVDWMRRQSNSAVDRMRLVELRLQEYRQAALLIGPLPNARHDLPARQQLRTRARLDDAGLGRFELVAAEDL